MKRSDERYVRGYTVAETREEKLWNGMQVATSSEGHEMLRGTVLATYSTASAEAAI